ncbi:hypothetical protein [Tateyamaria sp. syn59]|uniref:hypothetical protein n=1 Tax=Tateyamaria sp. syn59 TaxID=2576942 RepID=UPI0011BDF7C9|nr:hypothetical protein [Tateyamaria sp. syn59]
MHFAGHSVRAEANDPELAAFLAMGGTSDDLCLISERAHDHSHCPFCRELDVFVLADQNVAPALIAAVGFTTVLPSKHVFANAMRDVRPPARAPPTA